MKKLILVLSLFIFFLTDLKVDAAELISVSEIDMVVNRNKGIYYDANKDVVRVDFYGTRLDFGNIQYYHDANLTVEGTYKEFSASTNGWLTAVQFSCTGWYRSEVFLRDGSLAATIVVRIDEGDLKVDRCDSIYEEPEDDEIQQSLCNSKICECIAELQAPLDSIDQSIKETNSKLDTVNNNLSDLKNTTNEIKDVLVDFSNEFKTDVEYTIPPVPDVSDVLDKNKPVQNETPFKDNNTYFKDEGDAPDADPGKLPKAPDIKDWDGFKPELPMPPDEKLDKEKEKNTDKELSKDKPFDLDVFQKDEEMTKTELKKDSEMKIEKMEQDPSLKVDRVPEIDEFKQTGKFDKTNEFERDGFYGQTNFFGKEDSN